MALVKGSTRWVLFLASSHEPEQRHVLDLAFGLMCLESVGVDKNNVSIYIDGKDRALIQQWLSLGTSHSYNVKVSSEFFVDCANNAHEDMVMFVSGHGSAAGIDAAVPITPYALLQSIKSSPRLKNAIVYLGQCFAGIFNYMPAGRRSENEVNAVFIGATNLYESLSSATTEKLVGGDTSWNANLFLLSVFRWLTNKVDVDGDGKLTVMDSYKYAGVLSNAINKDIKRDLFIDSFELHQKWEAARKQVQSNPTLMAVVAFRAIDQKYMTLLDLRYVHQECWILNSVPAQVIEF